MQIFVDADACPKVAKELLYKVAERRQIMVTFVANRYLTLPTSANLKFLGVKPGSDVADHKIVELLVAGDLVVTADIPLANAVVQKGGFGLNPRGELYTVDNIGQHLSSRDLLASLRDSGMEFDGPPVYNAKDRQAFANQLDRFLSCQLR